MRVTLVEDESPRIRVVGRSEAEQVLHFAFVPLGGRHKERHGRIFPLFVGHVGAKAQELIASRQREDVLDGEQSTARSQVEPDHRRERPAAFDEVRGDGRQIVASTSDEYLVGSGRRLREEVERTVVEHRASLGDHRGVSRTATAPSIARWKRAGGRTLTQSRIASGTPMLSADAADIRRATASRRGSW